MIPFAIQANKSSFGPDQGWAELNFSLNYKLFYALIPLHLSYMRCMIEELVGTENRNTQLFIFPGKQIGARKEREEWKGIRTLLWKGDIEI